jgi:hypothetical protein
VFWRSTLLLCFQEAFKEENKTFKKQIPRLIQLLLLSNNFCWKINIAHVKVLKKEETFISFIASLFSIF